MLSEMRVSSAESLNKLSIITSGSTVRDFGSSTRRMSSALSSRTSPRSGAFFSSIKVASCSTSFDFCTRCGISVTTMRHMPRPRSSVCQRARTRKPPRPVSYASRIFSGGSTTMPPVGKSGPRMTVSRSSVVALLLSISSKQPSISSATLCGGMFVAMPTAMPLDPFANRFGNAAGRTTGSCLEPS